MSIKLKILLAAVLFFALLATQTLFFYFHQEALTDAYHAALSAHEAASEVQSDESLLMATGYAEMIAIFSGAMLLGIGVFYYLTRSILPPITKAISISNAIAVGYLENNIDESDKSEGGDLLRALASLQRSQLEISEHLERQITQTENAYVDMERSSAALNVANASLAALNASMNTMMDALEQGLFTFGADGICSDVSSKACLRLLDGSPSKQKVADALHLNSEEARNIDRLLHLIFIDGDPATEISDLLILFPDTYIRSDGTKISLTYHPILNDEGKITTILGVATDRSAEEDKIRLMHDREFDALRVLRISGSRNLFTQFYHSISSFFGELDKTVAEHNSLAMLRRDIHTFKGNASMFHLQDLVDALQEVETFMEDSLDTTQAYGVIKAELPKLQAILTKVHRQAYDIIGRDFDQQGVTRTLPLSALGNMANKLQASSNDKTLYSDFVENLMGEPIRTTLANFDINLQELADRYGKQISPCYFTGENFLLLTENYQALFSSLTHIARNVISHAIDEPDERIELNKDPKLTVVIETKKYMVGEQEWFSISFEDDGKGIDVAALRHKAIAQKPDASGIFEKMSDQEIMNLIFEDSLSTKQSADELAGRGVGLSAIKYEAEKLGGHVAVTSELGNYTRITIDAPFNWNPPQSAKA